MFSAIEEKAVDYFLKNTYKYINIHLFQYTFMQFINNIGRSYFISRHK